MRNSGVSVVCGDALVELGKLEDESADAIITDPPYCAGGHLESARQSAVGQGLRTETISRRGWFNGDNMGSLGLATLIRMLAVESVRIMKPDASLLFFCDWRLLPLLAPAAESAGLRYRNVVVWDKGSLGLGSGFRCQHEMIVHLVKGQGRFYAADVGNVLRCPRPSATERLHYTEKPLPLLRALLRVVAPGGGSSSIPSRDPGRRSSRRSSSG